MSVAPLTRAAQVITEVLSPYVIFALLPLAVAWRATGAVGETLLWGVIVVLTSSVIPMLFIVYGARRGRWEGHHVRNRDGRLVPFLAALASVSAGLLALLVFGAPWMMTALQIVLIAQLLVVLAVTLGWKVSIHAASVADAAVVLWWLYDTPWWLTGVMAVLVGLVCWARVRLTDHTVGQVVAGVPLGAIMVGGGFILLV